MRIAFCIFLAVCFSHHVDAKDFGPAVHNIQCRLTTVHPDTDDEKPSRDNPANAFTTGDDLTFLVELKNVGDKPITLKGIRYGNSWGKSSGRLNTNFFAPHFFQFQFFGADGKLVELPMRRIEGRIGATGSSLHQLKPGQQLEIVLRPADFRAPLNEILAAGKYSAMVRYTVAESSMRDKAKTADAWFHSCVSNKVQFSIDSNADSLTSPRLVWGPENGGLRTAVELTKPKYIEESTFTEPGVPIKSNLGVVFHIKNTSDEPITLVSESYRQGDEAVVTDVDGNKILASGTWHTGVPIHVHWELKPGQIAKLNVLSPGIGNITKAGEYKVFYKVRFNGWSTSDPDGKQVLPRKEHFQGVLETGSIPLFLRDRTIEDDDRAKPPNFVAKVQFVAPDGTPITKGSFTFRGEIKNRYHNDRLLKKGPITIPDCTLRPSFITVRAVGYEEQRFQYIEFKPGETKKLQLKPAKQAKFQLLRESDDSPIVNAEIRRFNKSYAKTSSGPFPTKGIDGEVWATSDHEGRVELGSLEKSDPDRAELGDAVYYFYVKPAEKDLAPMFVGPIRSGQNLGIFRLSEFVTLEGEVHGTKQELERFRAEWDQPFKQTNDNPKGTFLYAVSKRLKTKQENGKLTFTLQGLRKGNLRIISCFAKRPHSVGHEYGKRTVGEHDVLVEVELEQPTTKIVITPKGLQN